MGAPRRPPAAATEFDAAFDDLVLRRDPACRVRFLVTVANRRRLDGEIERLERYEDAPQFEARAVEAIDSLPMIVPLIVGDDVLLATDDQRMYRVNESIHLSGPGVARWAAAYFDTLWDDSRCVRVRTPSGLDLASVDTLRDRLPEH